MGTATFATTGFEREADKMLRAAGYLPERRTGSKHLMYKHRYKADLPMIRVPSTPKNGSESLVHIGHAIRKGRGTYALQGQEREMPKNPTRGASQDTTQKLVALASSYMVKKAQEQRDRKAADITGRRAPDRRYPEEISKWMRRCITAHAPIHNRDLIPAAELLELTQTQLSVARNACAAGAYRLPGMGTAENLTDFIARFPANAIPIGGRGVSRAKRAPTVRVDPERPAPADETPGVGEIENPGRRLEQGGLTPEEHQDAEQRMLAAHNLAEEERAAILAARGGGEMQTVAGETNGKAGVPTNLQAALEVLLQTAIEETHALSDQDILVLTGLRDSARQRAEQATAEAGMLTSLLKRVVKVSEEVPA